MTEDEYFRLLTTLFGIVCTDAWRAYHHHLPPNHHHKKLDVKAFASMLARDCFQNNHSTVMPVKDALTIIQKSLPINPNNAPILPNTVADVTATNTVPVLIEPMHKIAKVDEVECYTVEEMVNGQLQQYSRTRKVRVLCIVCKKKTKFHCPSCVLTQGRMRLWLCPDTGSRCCFANHHHHTVAKI